MYSLVPHFDMSRFDSGIRELLRIAEQESIPQVAKTYARELPLLYAQGIGGDGERLPDYNASYAKRMGKPVSPKTLSNNADRLYTMELDGDVLTVTDFEIGNTSARIVAHGQQTGASGKWPYSNVMFGLNEPIQVKAAEELAVFLTERIVG